MCPPWIYNIYMDGVTEGVKMELGITGVRFSDEERKWRLADLLYNDDLALYGEIEENLRVMVERPVDVCRMKI